MKLNLFREKRSKAISIIDESKQQSPIEKVIGSYLKIETNYALLINGARGIGKTFFVKNRILPQIKKIRLQHDNSKFYKPIYISL